MPMPGGRLQIAGQRESGADVRTQNVTAVSAIANIVKTSLGPVGLDKVRGAALRRGVAPEAPDRRRRGRAAAGSGARRCPPLAAADAHRPADAPRPPHASPSTSQMLVDDIGDVTVTNDGATILKLLEVEHPAAKVRSRPACGSSWRRPAAAPVQGAARQSWAAAAAALPSSSHTGASGAAH